MPICFPWPSKCKCCSYGLKANDFNGKRFTKLFPFPSVSFLNKRETPTLRTHILCDYQEFSVYQGSKCSLPNTFDWSQRESSINCRQLSRSVTYSVLLWVCFSWLCEWKRRQASSEKARWEDARPRSFWTCHCLLALCCCGAVQQSVTSQENTLEFSSSFDFQILHVGLCNIEKSELVSQQIVTEVSSVVLHFPNKLTVIDWALSHHFEVIT